MHSPVPEGYLLAMTFLFFMNDVFIFHFLSVVIKSRLLFLRNKSHGTVHLYLGRIKIHTKDNVFIELKICNIFREYS
ncbi:Hypoticical protein [Pectobacterium parmentieri]|uniref:Hypoticical protein n=1 Tax=Pectobacterium parmentieri TaxID=1905730 RepID=A0A0H3I8I5_PECPM|nr:Hypoticical protein [Pectobacterium parmentieri]